MIYIKSQDEIARMRESNRIIALVLNKLAEYMRPGISTSELDKIAEDIIKTEGAKPAFKGYSVPGLPPFPGSICASVNSCIVHGIPTRKAVLKEGDIIGVDVGTYKDGYCGDGARTYKVGDVSQDAVKVMDATKLALQRGIEAAKQGNRVGDISFAIQQVIKDFGYYAADNLTGHGIGKNLHEDPAIPNVGKKGMGERLKKGMTIAIEPMVNIGTNRVQERGWEYFVADGSLSAHFEHTVLITDSEPEILTRHG